MLSAHS